MPNRDMLINYVPGEECRIAIVENNRLEELYAERASDELHVSNIYRGKVTNVEPSIQAAFVDFGLQRNGFLHISDLHPCYFPGEEGATERVGMKTPRRNRPPIQQCLRRGQEVLVQVLKEGLGTKGPTLTSYLSIPGRFLVMMPGMERHGVSRKIEDEDKRRAMRKILDELNPPEEFGFIIRTAGIGRTKTELKRDLAYLNRLWRDIDRRMKSGKGPAELYTESDLVIRTIRDVLTNDVQRIIVDNQTAARHAREFLRIAMPRGSTKVLYYHQPTPIFDAFGIETQIESVNARSVKLACGGSLVFDQTEALVAIDVNSGKFRENRDAESTAYQTNCEAVDEIARQLRLRDLGGVVVLDLIDMYMAKHRRAIEKRFRDNLKSDRARTKITSINELGLLSMTRQRMRPSLKTSLYTECPTCHGASVVRTAESVVIEVMRELAGVLSCSPVHRVEVRIHPEVVGVLATRKKRALVRLEEELEKSIDIVADAAQPLDDFTLVGFDQRNVKLDLEKLPKPKPPVFTSADEAEAVDEITEADLIDDADDEEEEVSAPEQSDDEVQGEGGKRKRRRRRRRRGSGKGEKTEGHSPDEPAEQPESPDEPEAEQPEEPAPKKKRRRRRKSKSEKADKAEQAEKPEPQPEPPAEEAEPTDEAKPKRRRRRRRSRKSTGEAASAGEQTSAPQDEGDDQ